MPSRRDASLSTTTGTKLCKMLVRPLKGRKRRNFVVPVPQQTSRYRHRSEQAQKYQDQSQEQLLQENGEGEIQNRKGKRDAVALSSPTEVSDAAVLKKRRQIRTKQMTASRLLLLPSIETAAPKADKVTQEKNHELICFTAMLKAPRPIVRRLTAPRPPLSRRVAGLNRAKSGVGIVRCQSRKLNENDTETEEEESSLDTLPCRARSCTLTGSNVSQLVIDRGCLNDGSCFSKHDKWEDEVGMSVLTTDPSQIIYDSNFRKEQQQSSSHEESNIENMLFAATSFDRTAKDKQREEEMRS